MAVEASSEQDRQTLAVMLEEIGQQLGVDLRIVVIALRLPPSSHLLEEEFAHSALALHDSWCKKYAFHHRELTEVLEQSTCMEGSIREDQGSVPPDTKNHSGQVCGNPIDMDRPRIGQPPSATRNRGRFARG